MLERAKALSGLFCGRIRIEGDSHKVLQGTSGEDAFEVNGDLCGFERLFMDHLALSALGEGMGGANDENIEFLGERQ